MQGQRLIQAAFEAQARRRPEALAVAAAGRRLSYGELDAAANRMAGRILASAGATGEVVAILAERTPALVVGMLACLKAGRPFVVLDLAYPAARLESLVDICRPSLFLLAGSATAEPPPHIAGPRLTIDLEEGAGNHRLSAPPHELSPDAPAYLLFTSGSTGTPKCVACSHRPLVNFVTWQAEIFGLGEADRFTLLSGLSHDPVLRDVFTPLSLGASLHIPDQASLTAPGGLRAWFHQVRPTAAHMTPPLGRLLTAGSSAGERLADLRHVFWGGDVLRQSLVDALAGLAPGCESVNFYGSTETPQAAAWFRAAPGADRDRAPIGCGIDGFDVVIQDEHGRPAGPGRPGEIVIRSRFLTLGYVEQGRLPQPAAGAGQAVYATGDLGVRTGDGQVLIEGRRDDQVKVRGYRVEMGEITACALNTPGVGEAITLNLGDPDDVRLCCFVAAAEEWTTGLEDSVRRRLATSLPAYMVPDRIVALERLPLLPNGKVDRQALLARERSRIAAETAAPAGLSPIEAAVVAHWRSIFRRDRITPASSFSALGGDSLSYVNAYLALEEVLGAVPEGWTTMTIAELTRSRVAEPAARRSILARVESAIVLRALAIGAVVASHFGLLLSGGGATSALIWVSGFLFGGLQLHEAEHQASARPILRVLKSVLIPLAVFEAPQLIVKALTHHHFHWSSVFLYVDLLDYSGTPASGPGAYGGHEFLMWYIHCIVHILLLYAALFAVAHGLKLRRPAAAAMMTALGLGLCGRFLLPTMVDPHVWTAAVQPMSFFNHSPTTHLATFALAALAGFLRGRGRFAVLALALAYAALSLPLFGAVDAAAIGAVAALLLFAPQLPVPRILSRAVYSVAGASFFIYLLHLKIFMVLAGRLHLPPIAVWPLAMLAGVAAWSAWNWTVPRLGRLAGAVRIRAPRWTIVPVTPA